MTPVGSDALACVAGRVVAGPDECVGTVPLGVGERTAKTPPLARLPIRWTYCPRNTVAEACPIDQTIDWV